MFTRKVTWAATGFGWMICGTVRGEVPRMHIASKGLAISSKLTSREYEMDRNTCHPMQYNLKTQNILGSTSKHVYIASKLTQRRPPDRRYGIALHRKSDRRHSHLSSDPGIQGAHCTHHSGASYICKQESKRHRPMQGSRGRLNRRRCIADLLLLTTEPTHAQVT